MKRQTRASQRSVGEDKAANISRRERSTRSRTSSEELIILELPKPTRTRRASPSQSQAKDDDKVSVEKNTHVSTNEKEAKDKKKVLVSGEGTSLKNFTSQCRNLRGMLGKGENEDVKNSRERSVGDTGRRTRHQSGHSLNSTSGLKGTEIKGSDESLQIKSDQININKKDPQKGTNVGVFLLENSKEVKPSPTSPSFSGQVLLADNHSDSLCLGSESPAKNEYEFTRRRTSSGISALHSAEEAATSGDHEGISKRCVRSTQAEIDNQNEPNTKKSKQTAGTQAIKSERMEDGNIRNNGTMPKESNSMQISPKIENCGSSKRKNISGDGILQPQSSSSKVSSSFTGETSSVQRKRKRTVSASRSLAAEFEKSLSEIGKNVEGDETDLDFTQVKKKLDSKEIIQITSSPQTQALISTTPKEKAFHKHDSEIGRLNADTGIRDSTVNMLSSPMDTNKQKTVETRRESGHSNKDSLVASYETVNTLDSAESKNAIKNILVSGAERKDVITVQERSAESPTHSGLDINLFEGSDSKSEMGVVQISGDVDVVHNSPPLVVDNLQELSRYSEGVKNYSVGKNSHCKESSSNSKVSSVPDGGHIGSVDVNVPPGKKLSNQQACTTEDIQNHLKPEGKNERTTIETNSATYVYKFGESSHSDKLLQTLKVLPKKQEAHSLASATPKNKKKTASPKVSGSSEKGAGKTSKSVKGGTQTLKSTRKDMGKADQDVRALGEPMEELAADSGYHSEQWYPEVDDGEPFFFESDHVILKGNKDYRMLLRTLTTLEAQRKQAIEDLEKLVECQRQALSNPINFVENIQKKIEVKTPQSQRVVAIPEIIWETYLGKVGNPELLEAVAAQRINTRPSTKLKGGSHKSCLECAHGGGDHSLHKPSTLLSSTCEGTLTTVKSEFASTSSVGGSDKYLTQALKQTAEENRSETFNRPWSNEEQRKLDELLEKHPMETIEKRRWEKIANELGNRTPMQVASRVQKYFIKLTKAGLPVPGRIPNMTTYSTKKMRGGRNFPFHTPSTFLTSIQPPVYMQDDRWDWNEASMNLNSFEDDSSDDESVPLELRESEEYVELKRLKKLRRGKLKEQAQMTHSGFQCDSCGVEPITGTRWHCSDCPSNTSTDLCQKCMDREQPYRNHIHTSSHQLQPIRFSLEALFVDNDYTNFRQQMGTYNYLDPNYAPSDLPDT